MVSTHTHIVDWYWRNSFEKFNNLSDIFCFPLSLFFHKKSLERCFKKFVAFALWLADGVCVESTRSLFKNRCLDFQHSQLIYTEETHLKIPSKTNNLLWHFFVSSSPKIFRENFKRLIILLFASLVAFVRSLSVVYLNLDIYAFKTLTVDLYWRNTFLKIQAKKSSFCSHFFFFFPWKSLERCFQKFVVVAHRFTDGVGVVRRGQLGGRRADFNPELEVRVPFWLLLFQHLGCLAVGQPPVGRDGVTRDVTLDVGVTHLASVLSSFFSSEPLRLRLNKLECFSWQVFFQPFLIF